MTQDRITKKELMKMYGVDRNTIETWISRYNLPMIEISSHSKYVRKEDLQKWEDKLTRCKVNVIESDF
jgi:transposase